MADLTSKLGHGLARKLEHMRLLVGLVEVVVVQRRLHDERIRPTAIIVDDENSIFVPVRHPTSLHSTAVKVRRTVPDVINTVTNSCELNVRTLWAGLANRVRAFGQLWDVLMIVVPVGVVVFAQTLHISPRKAVEANRMSDVTREAVAAKLSLGQAGGKMVLYTEAEVMSSERTTASDDDTAGIQGNVDGACAEGDAVFVAFEA